MSKEIIKYKLKDKTKFDVLIDYGFELDDENDIYVLTIYSKNIKGMFVPYISLGDIIVMPHYPYKIVLNAHENGKNQFSGKDEWEFRVKELLEKLLEDEVIIEKMKNE